MKLSSILSIFGSDPAKVFRPPGFGTLATESGGLRHRQRYVALRAKPPTTNHQPPTTNHQPPTTNHQPTPPLHEPKEKVRTLIRDAIVVLPDQLAETKLLLEGGKIIAIDASRTSAAEEVIEGAGLHVLPGVFDDQVHFRWQA